MTIHSISVDSHVHRSPHNGASDGNQGWSSAAAVVEMSCDCNIMTVVDVQSTQVKSAVTCFTRQRINRLVVSVRCLSLRKMRLVDHDCHSDSLRRPPLSCCC